MRIVQGGYDFPQYHAQNKPTVGIAGAVFGIAGEMRRLPAHFDDPVSAIRLQHLVEDPFQNGTIFALAKFCT